MIEEMETCDSALSYLSWNSEPLRNWPITDVCCSNMIPGYHNAAAELNKKYQCAFSMPCLVVVYVSGERQCQKIMSPFVLFVLLYLLFKGYKSENSII